jgi:plastocyanin
MIAGIILFVLQASAFAGASQTIHIDNMQFQPATIAVKSGEVVTWENKDLVPHTVTSGDGSFDSGVVEPGKSWKHKFSKVGEFKYHCNLHPTMQASLSVKVK